MVTFNRIPYAVALNRGKIQEEILHELSEGINEIGEVDFKKAEVLVNDNLGKLILQDTDSLSESIGFASKSQRL
jgi:kynurenine 3-monooxygenase